MPVKFKGSPALHFFAILHVDVMPRGMQAGYSDNESIINLIWLLSLIICSATITHTQLNINPGIFMHNDVPKCNDLGPRNFRIDVELVWVIVAEHIIKLSTQIKLMMDSLSE